MGTVLLASRITDAGRYVLQRFFRSNSAENIGLKRGFIPLWCVYWQVPGPVLSAMTACLGKAGKLFTTRNPSE
jgi:hypothetical protein